MIIPANKLTSIQPWYDRHVAGTTLTYHDDIWIAFFLATVGVRIQQISNPVEGTLVYEQMVPNTVLAVQQGDLRREAIAKTHLPRLFREVNLPLTQKAGLAARAVSDRMDNLKRRLRLRLFRLAQKLH